MPGAEVNVSAVQCATKVVDTLDGDSVLLLCHEMTCAIRMISGLILQLSKKFDLLNKVPFPSRPKPSENAQRDDFFEGL